MKKICSHSKIDSKLIVWGFLTSTSSLAVTAGVDLVLVLVQDLLLQSFLQVATPLDDIRKSYLQCI